ncbi:MAG: c-type cytochrome [Smithellaceae bacterium]|nr:c-type cytochrome [Smithellaceae bacterium]
MPRFFALIIIMATAALLLAFQAGAADPYAEGRHMFEVSCQTCHLMKGQDGYATGFYQQYRPRDFSNPSSWKNLSDADIVRAITEGHGAMRPIGLTPEQMKAVVDYLTKEVKKNAM